MVRILSWNMNHWQRANPQAAWSFLADCRVDYALLQETVPLVDAADRLVFQEGGMADRGGWGSAVVSYGRPIRPVLEALSPYGKGRQPTSVLRTLPGCLAIADIGEGILLISAYGAHDAGYTVTTVHRLLSDVTPLLDSRSTRGVVFAGDLNLSTQLRPPNRERHRNALERFATLGLVACMETGRPEGNRLPGCPCIDDPCRHIQTYRHRTGKVPWQDDYVFVSRKLLGRVARCEVVDAGQSDPWELSDHKPILLEIDL